MTEKKKVLFLLPKKERDNKEKFGEILAKKTDLEPFFAYEAGEVENPEEFDIVVSFFYDWFRQILPKMEGLQWIHFLSAGVDLLWDWGLDKKGYIFSKSSGVHAQPISDHVMAMVLYFSRELGTFERQKIKKEWKGHHLEELQGMTMGILGLGAIGRACAQKARAFGMRVLGTAGHPREVEGVEYVGGPGAVEKVIRESDYLVVALPLTGKTQGLIGKEELEKMKKKAVIINIARGEIIKEPDLIECLEKEKIKGAGLDVFAEEPLPENSPLWEMENVLITPHNAGSTPYYMERALEIFLENWEAYRQGQPLPTGVDREKGY